jgi:hypothetical protein
MIVDHAQVQAGLALLVGEPLEFLYGRTRGVVQELDVFKHGH